MAESLASQTRRAMHGAEARLPSRKLRVVARARASTNEPSGERDRLLGEIVLEYRKGPRDVWAAVLLDVLTPAILARLVLYRTEPPGLDAEDIRQQFIVELLSAARSMPMPLGSGFVERRLILRAGQGVRRWLRKEGGYRARFESLEALRAGEEHGN
jgi:hypothetical protein